MSLRSGVDLMHLYLFKKNLNQLRPKKMVTKHANKLFTVRVSVMT